MMMSSVFAAASLWLLSAQEPPALPPLPLGSPLATLPLSAVAPGAHGTCYTVFEGDVVEPFAFVVKSVMPQFLGPEDDLLMVRLLGDKPEFTGVVAGMSGSPCFVDNKLIGALSYSFAAFAKEPIAGITPIAAMAKLHAMPEQARPYRRGPAMAQAAWPTAAGRPARAVGARAVTDLDATPPAAAVAMPTPIATPLGLGNMVPEVRDLFAPYLTAMGFLPMATGADRQAPGAPAAPQTLSPGSAVAVILAQGDINIAATGTVTAVDDGRVLAFGHPFTGGGAVSFPMATSRIVNTMASSQHSFKMAVAGATVGEISQDRLPAIAGTLGAVPDMVPVKACLQTEQNRSPFAFEVARDAVMTPRLVAMGALNGLTSRASALSRGTGALTATLEVEGHEPVISTFVEAHESGSLIFMQPVLKLYELMGTLWQTDFAPPGAVKVRLEAKLKATPLEETLENITFDRGYGISGGAVEVAVQLRSLTGHSHLERFLLPIPGRWSGEQLEIVAAGGDAAARFLQQLEGVPNPQCYGDVLAQLRRRPDEGVLYLFVLREGQNFHRGGRSYGAVPPSTLARLGPAPADAVLPQAIDFRGQRPRPGAVQGILKRPFYVAPAARLDRHSKAAKDL
jgi:hypothetical protein